jgi:Flp pilus assembly protein TadD
MLGDLYIDAGRLDAAGTLFEDFSRRVPTSAAGPTALGMVLEAQHRAAAAREAYERAVEIDPKSQVAIENLARVRSAGAPAR